MIAGRRGFVVVTGTLLFALLAWSLFPNLAPGPPSPGTPEQFADALWRDRALDVIVQAFLLLSGVLAVLLLLPERSGEATDG